MVQKEIQKATSPMNDLEFNQEKELIESFASPGSGVYQQQPYQLIASNYEITKLPPQQQHGDDHHNNNKEEAEGGGRPRQESIGSEGCCNNSDIVHPAATATATGARRESVGSESEANSTTNYSVGGRYRGDSIGSYASMNNNESSSFVPLSSPPNSPTAAGGGGGGQKQKHPNRGGNSTKKQRNFPIASMYLDDEGSSHFYQSQDGQLVFLSRFNMSCISYDFSSKVPDEVHDGAATTAAATTEQRQQQGGGEQMPKDTITTTDTIAAPTLSYWQRRKLLPLPDSVEGEILEIENVHLTPDMRKRMPFLAHIPLYTDIQFVELDLNNLLSMDCKKKFKNELDKRRKRRQSKVKAEKREDKMAQQKEEERINELKARMQRIDPNDEFFQVSVPEEPIDLGTGDAFGPAISGSSADQQQQPSTATSSSVAAASAAANRQQQQPAASFSNVCQAGGAYSIVTANSEVNFPALGSSPPAKSGATTTNPVPPTWGSPSRQQQQPPSWGQPASSLRPSAPSWGSSSRPISNLAPPSSMQSLVASAEASQQGADVSKQPPMPKSKKKAKGKKIVLFSSGGQRGTSY